MHVLLTRPESDAAPLKARIEALGCDVSVAPLLEIKLHAIPASAFSGAAALIATSRNGLKALAASPEALSQVRQLPVYAVGPATAALARSLGFSQVREGAGTAAVLLPLIAQDPGTRSGDIVHLAGDHLAFDLVGALREAGVSVRAVPAYASVAAETLPVDVVDRLRDGDIDAVILMSPRTAATWAALTSGAVLRPALARLTHICLSKAVADRLGDANDLNVMTAMRPDADAIVSLVYQLAADAKTG